MLRRGGGTLRTVFEEAGRLSCLHVGRRQRVALLLLLLPMCAVLLHLVDPCVLEASRAPLVADVAMVNDAGPVDGHAPGGRECDVGHEGAARVFCVVAGVAQTQQLLGLIVVMLLAIVMAPWGSDLGVGPPRASIVRGRGESSRARGDGLATLISLCVSLT